MWRARPVHSFIHVAIISSLAVTVLDWLDHQIYSAYNRNTHTPPTYLRPNLLPRLCTSVLPKPGFGIKSDALKIKVTTTIVTHFSVYFMTKAFSAKTKDPWKVEWTNGIKKQPKKLFKKLSSKNSHPKRFSKKSCQFRNPTRAGLL